MVHLIPLSSPDPSLRTPDADEVARPASVHAIGCLVLESFSDSQVSPQKLALARQLSGHVASAVHHSLTLRRVPLVGVWRTIGSLREWLHGRRLTRLLLIVGAILAVIAALSFVPYTYRFTAQGRLLPAERQRIFAPWEGDVVQLLVESGQSVQKGTPLIQLENEELRQQLTAARNQLDEATQRELSLQAEVDVAHREGSTEQEARLRGELSETRAQVSGLKQQVAILQTRHDRLLITAPTDGVVATFQIEQLLRHRPVTRGDLLIEIMRVDGPWELEVDIPDYRMGHLLKQLQHADGTTAVDFVLQTNMEQTFSGELSRADLGTRTTVNREGQAIVEARISLPESVTLERRIGAQVTAKIDCGRMNLGYVLFGDVVEFLRRHLWL